MKTSTKTLITLLIVVTLGTTTSSNGLLTERAPTTRDSIPEESPILSYTPHDAIEIDGNSELVSQALAESWPGNGSAAAPYLISGYYFNQNTQPLRMWNIDLHWAFIGNEITGGPTVQCGTWITNCTNGEISGNYIHGRHAGMWIEDITNFTIEDNVLSDNRLHAIEIVGNAVHVSVSGNTIKSNAGSGLRVTNAVDAVVSFNQISDCDGAGIQILGIAEECVFEENVIDSVTSIGLQLGYSTSVVIQENTIANSSASGIYILGSDSCTVFNNTVSLGHQNGVSLTNFNFGTFENNSITDTADFGISVTSGSNSTLRFNRVERSDDYALKLGASSANMTVSRNWFCDCGTVFQLCDDGTDNSVVFNCYHGFTTPDLDGDGIVDEPYPIDGSSENLDLYPLTGPNIVPVVPSTMATTQPTTGGSTTQPVPIELVLVAGGGLGVVLIGVFFVRRKV